MLLRRLASIAASFTSVAILLGCGLSSHAASFSSIVVYGDSLSDNGNLYKTIGYPPFPYYNGRFSNGPVAVEQLAAALNAPLLDFAYGGATSGVGNIVDGGTQTAAGAFQLPGMQVELGKTLGTTPTPGTADPNALYVVWGGANDFEAKGSPTVAAKNVSDIVKTLQGDGAQHILVPGLPNLGLTPEFYGNAIATGYTLAFNNALQGNLQGNAIYFDTYSVLNDIEANPGAFGITDLTTPCFDSTALTVCSNPTQHLFWDDIHPTTSADAFLAQDFATAVSPTPEPSSLLLLGTGAAGIGALLRKRRLAC